ncbi:MAG: deoxyribodipyrimidine photo-lyase [Hyphomicrobiaceae bacterium]
MYSPFARACHLAEPPRRPIAAPKELATPDVWPQSERLADWRLYEGRPDWAKSFEPLWQPGEAAGLTRLAAFLDGDVARYRAERDRPDLQSTSRLSPHLHFGEVSPHACWHGAGALAEAGGTAASGAEKFRAEVLWREFSHHLLVQFPDLPEKPFRSEFAAFPWEGDKEALRRWQKGATGYPIVDAGMRELWTTGTMHNRVRMIVASFLIKDLLIPWQEGERWFWDTLLDADLANNSASWQWVAGSGADAAPYFRIFNPVTQGLKFDPDGAYVRRFVPELARLPMPHIHEPWRAPKEVLEAAGVTLAKSYPWPMVDHGEARKRALAAFEEIKAAGERDGGA